MSDSSAEAAAAVSNIRMRLQSHNKRHIKHGSPDTSTTSLASCSSWSAFSSHIQQLPSTLLALIASNLPPQAILRLQRCSSTQRRLRASDAYMSAAWRCAELQLVYNVHTRQALQACPHLWHLYLQDDGSWRAQMGNAHTFAPVSRLRSLHLDQSDFNMYHEELHFGMGGMLNSPPSLTELHWTGINSEVDIEGLIAVLAHSTLEAVHIDGDPYDYYSKYDVHLSDAVGVEREGAWLSGRLMECATLQLTTGRRCGRGQRCGQRRGGKLRQRRRALSIGHAHSLHSRSGRRRESAARRAIAAAVRSAHSHSAYEAQLGGMAGAGRLFATMAAARRVAYRRCAR